MRISDWSSDVCSSDLQARVALEDRQVRLGQRHLQVVEHGAEERPVARHLRENFAAVGLDAVPQRVADAVPRRQAGAVLRPGEHPRDRAQPADAGVAPARGARTDVQALDHVDRRGGAEVVVETRLVVDQRAVAVRSEEHTSELQSLMRISYAVFCLKNKKKKKKN